MRILLIIDAELLKLVSVIVVKDRLVVLNLRLYIGILAVSIFLIDIIEGIDYLCIIIIEGLGL